MAALSFPLPLSEFFGGLKVTRVELYDRQPQEFSRTAGGSILRASLGASLWVGSVTMPSSRHDGQMETDAILSVLARPGASFFVTDPRRDGPKSDPDGAIYGSSTPSILSLDADNKRLSLQGLPANYVLQRGDMLSFQYGSPVQYALHRIVQGGTANGSGSTGLIEVTPFIRPGAAALDPVQLVRPYCKAVMASQPDFGVIEPGLSPGAAFDFVQTLT
jgi:hypothetical protein